MMTLLFAILAILPGDEPDYYRLYLSTWCEPAPAMASSSGPVITVFSPAWCSVCQGMEREIAKSSQTKLSFRFVHDEDAFPQWVQQRIEQGQVYPVLYWEAKPKQWVVTHGWDGIDKFSLHFKACAHNPKLNTVKPSRQRYSSRIYYGQYQSVYTWPGNLREHLQASPHNFPREMVEAMSDAECIRQHDQWHISRDGSKRLKSSDIRVRDRDGYVYRTKTRDNGRSEKVEYRKQRPSLLRRMFSRG